MRIKILIQLFAHDRRVLERLNAVARLPVGLRLRVFPEHLFIEKVEHFHDCLGVLAALVDDHVI